ncbi:hypothetical protein J4573_39525 [Actinomadura barringtoniae]|uniref:Uncharacterized protein n=1 Tax=Actinomadura barringtoniae TaxID=1427535 RepID=A0A939PIG1_9ACTN|nr:hypothetical protein [Actinomadura barringtoniae]MBO2453240.1 hypothetical protein [Actinomadura barringtoniae]
MIGLLTAASHSTAMQRYVWDQRGPTAIGVPQPGDPLIAGNFMVLVEQPGQPEVKRIEDGYGLIASQQVVAELLTALESGKSYRWRARDVEVEVSMAATDYASPLGTVHFDEPPRHYRPAGQPRRDLRNVEASKIVLLTEPEVIGDEIPRDGFAAFCDTVMTTVDTELAGAARAGGELVVRVELAPERPLYVQAAVNGGLAGEVVRPLVDRLNGLAAPPVRDHVIAFEMHFTLRRR